MLAQPPFQREPGPHIGLLGADIAAAGIQPQPLRAEGLESVVDKVAQEGLAFTLTRIGEGQTHQADGTGRKTDVAEDCKAARVVLPPDQHPGGRVGQIAGKGGFILVGQKAGVFGPCGKRPYKADIGRVGRPQHQTPTVAAKALRYRAERSARAALSVPRVTRSPPNWPTRATFMPPAAAMKAARSSARIATR